MPEPNPAVFCCFCGPIFAILITISLSAGYISEGSIEAQKMVPTLKFE